MVLYLINFGVFFHSTLKMNYCFSIFEGTEEARMVLKSKSMAATNPKFLSTDDDSDDFYNKAF